MTKGAEGAVHSMWGEPCTDTPGVIDRVRVLEGLLLEVGTRTRPGGMGETRCDQRVFP